MSRKAQGLGHQLQRREHQRKLPLHQEADSLVRSGDLNSPVLPTG